MTLGQPDQLNASATLGRLLILGLVTGTEAYFRGVLYGLASLCPLARESLAESEIPFGVIDFYGSDQAALGLFERVSFAGRAGIKEMTKKVAGLSWADKSSLGVAISNYEQVCHIRHAAVHSQGVLNRGNARVLGVSGPARPLNVVIDLPHFHTAAKACTNLVRDYNRFAFDGVLQRWIRNKLLVGRWQDGKAFFGPLLKLFRSDEDGLLKAQPYSVYRSLQAGIAKRYAGS